MCKMCLIIIAGNSLWAIRASQMEKGEGRGGGLGGAGLRAGGKGHRRLK